MATTSTPASGSSPLVIRAQHTEGPWRLQVGNPAKIEITCDSRLAPIHKPSGNRVAEIRPKRIGRGGAFSVTDVDKANARLIAAAPEMFEALKPLAFFNGKPSSDADMERLSALFANARAALSKATGA